MVRYFLEVAYKGTHYGGFQVQTNAHTIQGEVEKALLVYFRMKIDLTGSSRTDAGVHALQNFFHFDCEIALDLKGQGAVYHLNAILPQDIVVKEIKEVENDAHCRFDATSRMYEYTLYWSKNPFLADRAFYYPYKLDLEKLQAAAVLVKETEDFEAFSKRKVQVQHFRCNIYESSWLYGVDQTLVYRVRGNRFLRGMVRGLVGTMLKVGTGKINTETFKEIIDSRDVQKADFSMPAHGLTLMKVSY